jgi:3-methylcrotonyl-CoA carboxylase alpha subunit
MFNTILIANRGEIACRIIKTAKQLGITTVAIYSSADSNSLHVQKADKAYFVGDALASLSYLNIEAIIKVALASGAQAIHPGYGFLSENPSFATACVDAGIIFIGPSVASMNAMASKQLAKQLLEKTNVPLTPGYHGHIQTDERLWQEALKIGFPLILKAANGGGGKGMRAVYTAGEFTHALAGARREAQANFADDTMIIEKFLLNPRHIEIQIMADNYGQVVHLFERDCSIQRRHQKIIEEAPSNINSILRLNLVQAACDVARSIDYQGAGTVEFLVADNDTFYFMEMNTRLQVEHPVTEMITGFDLVAWQLQIAANYPLPCSQASIGMNGHAIECRIYAEDPNQCFMPSIGHIHRLKEPQGLGIRVDSGVTINTSISQYYDPMIAKLIVWGENRRQALQRLQHALNSYAIGGVKTNIAFLQAICQHPRFQNGQLDTHFLTDETITIHPTALLDTLLLAISYDYLALNPTTIDPVFYHTFAWQMHLTSHWQLTYIIDNTLYHCTITPVNPKQLFILIKQNKEVFFSTKTVITVAYTSSKRLVIDDGYQQYAAWIDNQEDKLTVYLPTGVRTVMRFRWQSLTLTTDNQTTDQLTAPMPATIVAILKHQGETVKKGDLLIVLDTMKMEHTIHAPYDGIITELFCTIGQQVTEGAKLLILNNARDNHGLSTTGHHR